MSHFRSTITRLPCRNLNTFPSESQIVRDLRQGNFDRAIKRFCKRPSHHRSNALHESLILACAQVPDAVAAQAVLHAMPAPTPSAVHQVITAFCRQHNVPAALDLLAKLPQWKIPLDERMLALVTRAARRNSHGNRKEELRRLQIISEDHYVGKPNFYPLSAADLFVEDGGDCQTFLSDLNQGRGAERDISANRSDLKKVLSAEAALRAARGNVKQVNLLWNTFQQDSALAGEVGVLAAAISASAAAPESGGPPALNLLMTWIRRFLYDDQSGRGIPLYTENPSAMALLITSATTALATTARPAPRLALSAFDALWEMRLPRFRRSLPLAGAYFKVLQHAELSLEETTRRIATVRDHHIQLDEQGFSMALGAILRCDERVVDKLAAGKAWTTKMRTAGISLSVQTYNLFAGQLRYCNDPELVTSLLSDMTNNGLVPTPVTYGLVFNACVIPGDYSSPSRKNALPVAVWNRVLMGMEEHMQVAGVLHTPNSRLSLARAYAHLGIVESALREFEEYHVQLKLSSSIDITSRGELEEAYRQMIFNLAHCRECSFDGPQTALNLLEQMRADGLPISSLVLDSILVACVRLGRGQSAVEFAATSLSENADLTLGPSGLKHLLMAHAEVCEPEYWFKTRPLVVGALHKFPSADVLKTLKKLVISFARNRHQDICDDIMGMAGIEVCDLDYIISGREFFRIRSQGSRRRTTVGSRSHPVIKTDFSHESKKASKSNESSNHAGVFNSGSILPL